MDPPTGLHCSNSLDSYPFENNYCKGKYYYFHPPTTDGVDQWCADYFKGKTRLWELRIQLQFKHLPSSDSEMYFGIELEGYVPISSATKRAQSLLIAAIRSAMGGVYQSNGDDPDTCTGELEKPCTVLPLWAFDQFIVTPKDQEPPKLTDPKFPQMGKKRYKRINEFVKELDAVRSNFDTESTYTFSSWGVARFLDVINWNILGIPLITPISFNKFAGRPPVYAVLYGMSPSSDKDGRHLTSRKQYFYRAAVWSSSMRPEKNRFDVLTGTNSLHPLAEGSPSTKVNTGLWRRASGLFNGSTIACCTSRPQ